MAKVSVVLVTSALILFGCSICSAADLDERITIIHVKHKAQRYSIEQWDSRSKRVMEDIPLDSNQKISLRPGERVQIVVDDPNPFLYTYSLTTGTPTPTANAKAAQEFAASLLGLVNILDPPKRVSQLRRDEGGGRSFTGGIRLAAFRQEDDLILRADLGQRESTEHILDKAAQDLESVVLPSTEVLGKPPSEQEAGTYARERMQIVKEAIEAVGGQQDPSAGGAAIREVFKDAGITDPGAFLQKLKEDVARLYLFISQINALVKEVDEGKALAAQATVASWPLDSLAKDIQGAYAKLDLINQKVSARLGAQQQIRMSPELQAAVALELAKQSPPGTDLGAAVSKVLERALADVDKRLAALRKIRETLEKQLSSGVKSVNEFEEAGRKLEELEGRKLTLKEFTRQLAVLGALTEGLATDPFSLNLDRILPYADKTVESVKRLQTFALAMGRVDKPEGLGLASFSSDVTPTIVVVKAAENIPEGVKASRLMTSYTFSFQPYSSVDLGVGGAVVYSFVEKHTFSATRSADGKLVIVDTESGDYTGTKVAAMLTIVPTAWAESDFHPLFEIGVTPASNVGVYAGVGLRFSNLFSAGAGVAFEQVDELKSGLAPGDELTSADQLKIQKRFVPGLYLHFTLSVGVGGGK